MKNRFKLSQRTKKAWRFFALATTAVLIAASFIAITQKSHSNTVQADAFSSCRPEGILFQYQNGALHDPPTSVNEVDLISNTLTNPLANTPNAAGIPSGAINAIGYNVADNYIYGWDNTDYSNTHLVRIHGDFITVNAIPRASITGLPSTANLGNVPAGEVDASNRYWFAYRDAQPPHALMWGSIDLNALTFTGGTMASLTGAIPASATEVLDWAYVPGTFLNDNQEGLYTVVEDGGSVYMYRFDISNPAAPVVTQIGPGGAPGPMPEMAPADIPAGALYADSLGALYIGSNNGKLWHVIIGNPGLGIDLTVLGPTHGSAANGNDGARCFQAAPPADFGDAPTSYATQWEHFGPLHVVSKLDFDNSLSPLMLGQKIDVEADGLPGAQANGDDLDHAPPPYLNDEDGVQHIVAPPTPVDLSIPVTVTNTDTANPATLVAWIDKNNDGSFFDDDPQKIVQNIPAGSGTQTYNVTFTGLDFSAGTNTFARFRVFQGTGLDDDMLQPGGIDSAFRIGEVEDYLVQVGSFGTKKTSNPASGSTVTPGQEITYTLEIDNTGTTDLIGLTVHDDLSDVLDDATIEGNPVVSPGSAGSATVIGNTLQFDGDIPTGQNVTVTYRVKVKPANQLANKSIRNLIIAAHSNCHPQLQNGGAVHNGDPSCQTIHPINDGLANTGQNPMPWVVASVALISVSALLSLPRWFPRFTRTI